MLEIKDDGAVRTMTMAAPERLNALSDQMLAELTAAFEAAKGDPTRVIILRGSGKAFCAGHDLREMTAARQSDDGGAAAFGDLFDRCATLMQIIRDLPQPVIAQVHGIATAAGCQLVASCDMAVAAEGTKFGVNGVNIGLFCSTPMVALSRNTPAKKAFEMLVTGEFIDATRAEELGLVDRVVPHEDLESETRALAELVASKLGAAVKIGKGAFYEQLEQPLDEAYRLTGAAMVENMLHAQTEKGIGNFLNKQPQEWDQ